ncbi:hypothetical protein [Nannocystis bainbridge]|uniref:Uncharacterized protein n=1 Tax=Nannocystis bainbridge TaxID=2995303 RepID=A0ABT5DTR2_9BACT|nr:hypothetical protein [Nannocystis bainbridge]MDC0715786.1 hypothetical protein [Nannocystis bainbridge]
MSGTSQQVREFVLVTAAAAALVGLGVAVTYQSCSLAAGTGATLVLGLPLVLRGVWGGFGLAGAGLLVFLGGMPLAEYGRITGGEPVALSLAEFAGRPEVERATLTEAARVDGSRAVKVSHRHDNGKASPRRDHAVAPVVPASWQPGEPVQVFAACYNVAIDRGCSDAWSVASDELVRVPADQAACYRELVPAGTNLDAVAFVVWDRPGSHVEALWARWVRALRVIGLSWLGLGTLILIGRAVSDRRHERALRRG